MEKITDNQCTKLIKKEFPKFLPYWETYIKDFGLDDGLCFDLMPFGKYTIDVIKVNDEVEMKKNF